MPISAGRAAPILCPHAPQTTTEPSPAGVYPTAIPCPHAHPTTDKPSPAGVYPAAVSCPHTHPAAISQRPSPALAFLRQRSLKRKPVPLEN